MKKIKQLVSQYGNLSRSAYVFPLANGINLIGGYIWPLIALILNVKLGISPGKVGFFIAGFKIISIPCTMLGGKIADTIDKKKLLFYCETANSILFFACVVFPSTEFMVFALTLAAIIGFIRTPSFNALIVDTTLPSERDNVFSLLYFSSNVGLLIGAVVGGLLFNNYLHIAFIIDGITTFIAAAVIFFLTQPVTEARIRELDENNEYEKPLKNEEKTYHFLRKNPSIMLFFTTNSIGRFVFSQWCFLLPLYLAHMYPEQGAKFYGFLSSTNCFLAILLTPVLTLAFTHMRELPKMIIGGACFTVSYLLMGEANSYAFFFFIVLLFTFGEALYILGQQPYLSKRVPENYRGRMMGLSTSLKELIGFIGQIGLGIVLEWYGFTVAFEVIAGVSLLVSAVMLYNYRCDKQLFPKLHTSTVQP